MSLPLRMWSFLILNDFLGFQVQKLRGSFHVRRSRAKNLNMSKISWNFISREISFWFQNILNFLNPTSIRKVMAGWNLQCSHLI